MNPVKKTNIFQKLAENNPGKYDENFGLQLVATNLIFLDTFIYTFLFFLFFVIFS